MNKHEQKMIQPIISKVSAGMYYPCDEQFVVTKEEFERASAYEKGYIIYAQAAWHNSPLDDECPDEIKNDPEQHALYIEGANSAMFDVLEMES